MVLPASDPNQIQRLVLHNYLHRQLISHRAKLERLSLCAKITAGVGVADVANPLAYYYTALWEQNVQADILAVIVAF
jgi:hypothetical protein